jgi:electron transfer flavoprotein alpha subunit
LAELWVVLQEQAGLAPEHNEEVVAEVQDLARRHPAQPQLCAIQLGSAATPPFTFSHVVPQHLYVLEHDRLKQYSTEAYVSALAWLIRERAPLLIATSASANGQDWAARLAARLRLPFVPRCLGFDLQDDALLALRALYGGRAYAQTRTTLHHRTAVLTFVPGVRGIPPGTSQLDAAPPSLLRLTPAIPPADPQDLHRSGIAAPSAEEIELEAADKIVAGGRGIGREGFRELAAFARQLGAAVGASRVATDRGWVEQERQIGATGKSVRPRLYIACGISGAVQHTSGIREAHTIVAINPDRNAPIFALADLGLLGDANQILPRAAELLQKRKA